MHSMNLYRTYCSC